MHTNKTNIQIQLHTLNQRATPEQYMLYKHALQLYKVFEQYGTSTQLVNAELDTV